MNDGIDALLGLMGKIGASTLHLTVGMPPVYRINGEIKPLSDLVRDPDAAALAKRMGVLRPDNISLLANQLLTSDRHRKSLSESGSANPPRSIPGIGRFRTNVYTQRGSLAVVCHALLERIPLLDIFSGEIEEFLKMHSSLVLVTGPVGSGKTTLLAAMINHINETEARHVLVIEDPIEYLHTHQRSLVNQRQIGDDVRSYPEALAEAVSQDADMIFAGGLPDGESIMKAIAVAEAGRLVVASVAATTPGGAVARLMEIAQPKEAVGFRLAGVLGGVIVLDGDHKTRLISREDAVELIGGEREK